MNYRQTLDYLFAQLPMFQRVGAAAYKADLGTTIELCTLLDHPENEFSSVHIAGTNGKGSTSHLIASVLQSAGYKTGLFTSPHLKDFRERIKIDGRKVPKSFVTQFVSCNRKRFRHVRPSFFEYTAVMAFQYFKEEQVDVAVIETGMGGRLDSTNVITPLLSIITNISMDHMAFLGDTIEKIAAEKAGIIKPGVPIVIGETQPGTENLFRQIAALAIAPIFFSDQRYRLERNIDEKHIFNIMAIDRAQGESNDAPMECPLTGNYQDKNLVTAYQALQILGSALPIKETDIRDGFKAVIKLTGLQGRWQIIKKRPRVICDVGHNEAGIRYVTEQLRTEDYIRLHWVFGIVNDKDSDSILRQLPRNAVFYFCKANIPRGMDAQELKNRAGQYGLQGEIYPSVSAAYATALQAANSKDLVFVGGSTFVVAEVL